MDELKHVGVLGMHWGRRKSSSEIANDNAKRLKKSQDTWDKKAKDPRNTVKAYNQAADYANKVLIPKINKKYGKYDWTQLKHDNNDWRNPKGDPKLVAAYKKYLDEYDRSFMKIFDKKLYEVVGGERPK